MTLFSIFTSLCFAVRWFTVSQGLMRMVVTKQGLVGKLFAPVRWLGFKSRFMTDSLGREWWKKWYLRKTLFNSFPTSSQWHTSSWIWMDVFNGIWYFALLVKKVTLMWSKSSNRKECILHVHHSVERAPYLRMFPLRKAKRATGIFQKKWTAP